MLVLAEQLQLQAYHCSLIVSCVYLLLLSNHEEGSSLTDHQAVQKVPPLLDSIVKGLNKREWNEVESKNRHQLVAAILNNLIPMFSTMLCSDVPLETAAKAATVSGVLAARVPKGFVDIVGQIAKGKVCVHTSTGSAPPKSSFSTISAILNVALSWYYVLLYFCLLYTYVCVIAFLSYNAPQINAHKHVYAQHTIT